MRISSLVNSSKAIVSTFQSFFGKAEIDRGYDSYERTPVRQNEISELLELHYRKDDPRGYSKSERLEHENIITLREILYPPSAS